MLRKVLIYPFLAFVLILTIATAYMFMADKQTRHSNIRVENATLRLPAPGQTTVAAYFDIINDGGANQLLSVATPISNKVELHTHLHENGMMKMRMVKSVKVLPEQITKFERMGLHVMIFNARIPEGITEVPLTLTFARPLKLVATDRKVKDKREAVKITVIAQIEG